MLAGAPCSVAFEPASKPGLNCRVSVVCAGVSLYGAQRLGGYAACDVDDTGQAVSVEELGTSSDDGDPALRIDLLRGEGAVWDSGWEVTLTLRR